MEGSLESHSPLVLTEPSKEPQSLDGTLCVCQGILWSILKASISTSEYRDASHTQQGQGELV